MLKYQRNVQALLVDVSQHVSDQFLHETPRLVEHGEAPLGMTQQVWILRDEQLPVPTGIVQGIREYSDANEKFPPDLLVLCNSAVVPRTRNGSVAARVLGQQTAQPHMTENPLSPPNLRSPSPLCRGLMT